MQAAQPLPATSLLQLMWLASPALPVGGFSYSEGLEAAVDQGHIRNEAEASDWLTDQLHLSQARSDLPVVAQAVAAWRAHDLPRITTLNDWVLTTRETSELRQQTQQTGRSLLEWLRQLPTVDETEPTSLPDHIAFAQALPPTWPVAFALAAAQTAAPVRECVLACVFGWAENMAQAAIKAVPLGQTGGQRILARLLQAIPAAVDSAIALPDDQRQAFSPMLAILSAQHETQYSRLFRS
ncbi:MAG: urease accessory UreF family protein [Burkholderiaceae bacterium]|nr:urease accessory UreF family protein [Burkholderiaceae bacterium]MDZ4162858.1 urease accessory UreF family protein [Burkholderiales bacterium]